MNDATALRIERRNAAAIGVHINVNVWEDRRDDDDNDTIERRPATRHDRADRECPTCEDGMLTVLNPRRCWRCSREGL